MKENISISDVFQNKQLKLNSKLYKFLSGILQSDVCSLYLKCEHKMKIVLTDRKSSMVCICKHNASSVRFWLDATFQMFNTTVCSSIRCTVGSEGTWVCYQLQRSVFERHIGEVSGKVLSGILTLQLHLQLKSFLQPVLKILHNNRNQIKQVQTPDVHTNLLPARIQMWSSELNSW